MYLPTIYETPFILSLFEIVTLNFILFILTILTYFLKIMSLENRFSNLFFEYTIIFYLYCHLSEWLYSS